MRPKLVAGPGSARPSRWQKPSFLLSRPDGHPPGQSIARHRGQRLRTQATPLKKRRKSSTWKCHVLADGSCQDGGKVVRRGPCQRLGQAQHHCCRGSALHGGLRLRLDAAQIDPLGQCLGAFSALAVAIDQVGGAAPSEECEFHQLFHDIDNALIVG